MAVDRVVLIVEGLMLERLVCRALAEGAVFLRISRESRRILRLETNASGAKTVRGLCEKYRIDCRVISVHGLSAFTAWLRSRPTIAAAFITAAVCCALFFSRVWIVDISVLKGDSLPAGVESVLAESGIIKGAYIGDIDTRLAELRLRALEGCAHASVSRKGVTVTAEIACEEAAPEIAAIEGSGDLVAACDGVISSINVRSGTAMVKPGDTVRKGQVLISGYERESKESVRDVIAQGSVKARSWVQGEAEAHLVYEERRFTGSESSSAALVTPWLSVDIYAGEEYALCTVETERAAIGGLFIPLYIERTLRREYTLMPVEGDVEALKAAIYEKSEENAYQKVPESAEIIDKWTDFSMIESEVIIHARTVIEIETEIAVTRGYMEENQVD